MSDVKVADVRGEIKDDPETLYLMDHPDSTEEIPTGPISTTSRAGAKKSLPNWVRFRGLSGSST